MEGKKLKPSKPVESEKPKMIAKKDFTIFCNDLIREIKTGDDLSDLPEKFVVNMKTEGVL